MTRSYAMPIHATPGIISSAPSGGHGSVRTRTVGRHKRQPLLACAAFYARIAATVPVSALLLQKLSSALLRVFGAVSSVPACRCASDDAANLQIFHRYGCTRPSFVASPILP